MKFNYLKSIAPVFTFLAISFCIRAENADNSYKPKLHYIPPSPQSMVFQQFKGFDPDYSTGAVNATIPLHTISFDDFTLPLALNYQSNGIKPEDTYFPLGYGWTLHPGFRITRTIMGRSDETCDKEFLNQLKENYPEYITKLYSNLYLQDYQYDIFTISLPSGSATFLLYGDSKSTLVPYQYGSPYQIEMIGTGADLTGFKVTDENGIKYYFGNENINSSGYLEGAEGAASPTAYYLRKVVLPGNKEISFSWEASPSGGYTVGANYSFSFFDYYHHVSCPLPSIPNNTINSWMGNVGTYSSKVLSSIVGPNFKVEAQYSGTQLKALNIKDAQGNTAKQVLFDISDNLLKKISINSIEDYKFDYYYPHLYKNFRCVDFWGYYNGKYSEGGNYPAMTVSTQSTFYANGLTLNTPHTEMIDGADRFPNADSAKVNLLKQIIYPSGGTTLFEYESNAYNAIHSGISRKMSRGGGLRVSRITTQADYRSPTITKVYKYGLNEDGYGICTAEPNEDTFVTENYVTNQYSYVDSKCIEGYRMLSISPVSKLSSYFMFNPTVWYPYVTEYTEGGGKVEYTFEFAPDDLIQLTYPEPTYVSLPLGVRNYPNYGINNMKNIFRKGASLKNKKIYKKDEAGYKLLSNEYMKYNTLHDEEMGKLLKYAYISKMTTYSKDPDMWGNIRNYNQYEYLESTIDPVVSKLEYTEKTEDGVIQKTFNEYYTDLQPFNLKSTTTFNSDNTTLKEIFLYPNNSADELSELTTSQKKNIDILVGQNRLTTPIRRSRMVGNNQLALQRTTEFTPLSRSTVGDSIPFVVPSKDYLKIRDDDEKVYIDYQAYNKKGKPAYIITDKNEKIVYLWSYLSQYPIAEIKNATYDQIKSLLGEDLINRVTEAITPDQTDLDRINSLRSSISEAIVSTYTYKPLVGITSATDARGVTSYYQYDLNNRLIQKGIISNESRKKIEEYQYNLNSEPLFGAIIENISSSFYVNECKRLDAAVFNGSGNISYSWYINGEKQTSNIVLNNTCLFCPKEVGKYAVTCMVRDLTKNKQITLDYSLNVVYQPLTASLSVNNGLDIAAQKSFDIRVDTEGGTSSFSYQWLIQNSLGDTILFKSTSQNNISATLTEPGKHQIICKITDLKTGETNTSSSTVWVRAFIPAIVKGNGNEIEDSYEAGTTETFHLTTQGGSGNFSYYWSANIDGVEIATSQDKNFTVTFNSDGNASIECLVTDLSNGEFEHPEVNTTIIPQYLKFENTQTLSNGNLKDVTATIIAKQETKVYLQVAYSGQGVLDFSITNGSGNFTLYNATNTIKTIVLKPGNNKIQVELTKTDSSFAPSATIEITGVEKGVFIDENKININF